MLSFSLLPPLLSLSRSLSLSLPLSLPLSLLLSRVLPSRPQHHILQLWSINTQFQESCRKKSDCSRSSLFYSGSGTRCTRRGSDNRQSAVDCAWLVHRAKAEGSERTEQDRPTGSSVGWWRLDSVNEATPSQSVTARVGDALFLTDSHSNWNVSVDNHDHSNVSID